MTCLVSHCSWVRAWIVVISMLRYARESSNNEMNWYLCESPSKFKKSSSDVHLMSLLVSHVFFFIFRCDCESPLNGLLKLWNYYFPLNQINKLFSRFIRSKNNWSIDRAETEWDKRLRESSAIIQWIYWKGIRCHRSRRVIDWLAYKFHNSCCAALRLTLRKTSCLILSDLKEALFWRQFSSFSCENLWMHLPRKALLVADIDSNEK